MTSDLLIGPVREKRFVTAGNATFTLELPSTFVSAHGCKPWYTFNVSLWPADRNKLNRDIFNVSLLSGPNNDADYSYLGQLNPHNGDVRLTKASKFNDESWPVRLLRRVMFRLWAGDLEPVFAAGFDIKHSGYCGRCGRKLTVPSSIETGLGPVCANLTAHSFT